MTDANENCCPETISEIADGSNMKQAEKRFMHCDRLHHSIIERRFRRYGVHRSQHAMLMYLAKNDRTPTQKELTEAFEISAAAVTATLKKLEAGGYVKKAAQDNDNRFNQITITEKGRAVVEESHAIFEHVNRAMFNGFSDGELNTFQHLLERMEANLYELEASETAVVPAEPEQEGNKI